MSREKPVLFNTRMVTALLNNRKTQMCIPIKPQPVLTPHADGVFNVPHWDWLDCVWLDGGLGMPETGIEDYAPYHKNDILWVRETWNQASDGTYIYKVDDTVKGIYKPSIHMPRCAARIYLRVKDVKAERLHDITEKNAEAEGYKAVGDMSAKKLFFCDWDSIHIKQGYGWYMNPWVWVIEFMKL